MVLIISLYNYSAIITTQSSTSTPVPTPGATSSVTSADINIIVGAVVGGLVGIAVIVGLLVIRSRRRRMHRRGIQLAEPRTRPSHTSASEPTPPPQGTGRGRHAHYPPQTPDGSTLSLPLLVPGASASQREDSTAVDSDESVSRSKFAMRQEKTGRPAQAVQLMEKTAAAPQGAEARRQRSLRSTDLSSGPGSSPSGSGSGTQREIEELREEMDRLKQQQRQVMWELSDGTPPVYEQR